jgi:CheY-like chemotaxis protein
VLVVEDSPDMLLSWLLLLELWGYEPYTVSDGPAAVEAAGTLQPDIVLLDIGLPSLDGWEVARRIRQRGGPQPLLIAVTGYGQDKDRRRSHEAGIDHHLLKPVDLDRLEMLLAQSEWQQQPDASADPGDWSETRPEPAPADKQLTGATGPAPG